MLEMNVLETPARAPPVAVGRPITQRLGLLVLSILIPAIVLSGGLIWHVGQLDRSRANQQALQLARSVAGDLNREVDGSIETLLALATSPALKRGDFETFYRQATDTLSFRRLNALVKTPDGQQVLNTRVPFGTPLPRQELALNDREALVNRKSGISALVLGGVTKSWVLGLSVPVIVNDQVNYILTMSIDPEHIRKIIASAPPDPEWIIAVSDPTGRLIARTEQHNAYLGKIVHPDVKGWSKPPEGIHRTVALTGEEVLRGYHWSDKSGWLIAAFVPARVIDAPLRRLWRILAMFLVGLTALALPLTYKLARQISRPIAEAAAAAHRLGQGQLIEPKSSALLEANELSAAIARASVELRQRTSALAENEARFRSVFEQSAVGISQIGLDGRLIGVNDWLCKMLGYTREECLEKTFRVLTHPDDLAVEEQLITELLNGTRRDYRLEKRVIMKSGAPVWVRVTSAPVRGAAGELLHRVSIIEDITASRQASAESARLAAIVQASQDAIISTSLGGAIETWNSGAEALFGYTRQEVTGKNAVHARAGSTQAGDEGKAHRGGDG